MREREISQRGRNILKRETRKRERPQRSREILPHTERKLPKRFHRERKRGRFQRKRVIQERGSPKRGGPDPLEKNISQGGDPKRERERKRPRRKKDLKEIRES